MARSRADDRILRQTARNGFIVPVVRALYIVIDRIGRTYPGVAQIEFFILETIFFKASLFGDYVIIPLA